MAFSYPVDYDEGTVAIVSPNRKVIYTDGCWKLYMNTIPGFVPGDGNVGATMYPITDTMSPPLPSDNPYWWNPDESQMYFCPEDGTAWLPL